ncbi:MAG: hypothetical protein RL576_1444, partial [Actinomycetota bacterium]
AFHNAIGSESFYTSSSIDQPGKAIAPLRHGAWAAGVQGFETADVAMVIGCNTLVSTFGYPGGIPGFNPLVRLRQAKERGLFLIVIDPRFTEVAHYADLYLPVRAGEDPTLLAGIIRQILATDSYDKDFCGRYVNGLDELRIAVDPFTLDYVSQRAGVEQELIVTAAKKFAEGPRGAVTTGTGPDMAPHSSLTEHLVLVLNTLCGRYNREGETMYNPGGLMTPPGQIRAGVIPPKPEMLTKGSKSRMRDIYMQRGQAATSTLAEEILLEGEGQIRALFTLGGNPVVSWPDQRTTVEALRALDLHVLMDVHVSPSAQLAHYVIASTLSLERPDVPTTIDRWFDQPYQHYTPAILEMRGEFAKSGRSTPRLRHDSVSPSRCQVETSRQECTSPVTMCLISFMQKRSCHLRSCANTWAGIFSLNTSPLFSLQTQRARRGWKWFLQELPKRCSMYSASRHLVRSFMVLTPRCIPSA